MTLSPSDPDKKRPADGLAAIGTFSYNGETWKAYKNIARCDGPLVLVVASGTRREIKRYVEATSVESLELNRTLGPFFDLNSANDVNLKQNDVLAERLLQDGEPIEEHVRDVVNMGMAYGPWDAFLGNVEANDTMTLNWQATTKNYMPLVDEPEAADGTHSNYTFDGLLGGWLPSPRKIFRGDVDTTDWIEVTTFADVRLISGWSESDALLRWDSWRWEKPYWNNGAFAARGLKDLSKIATFEQYAQDWQTRAAQLINQTSHTLDAVIQRNLTPPYVPLLPNETTHVLEDLEEQGNASSQWWPRRVYSELLQASVLSSNLTDLVINSMQAYGITSLGVVANVTPLRAETRDILGFISYGYALTLLLQDRLDEFSFAVPILLRAALLLDHPNEEVLFVGRGVPRRWLSKGRVAIQKTPTKWGLVDLDIQLDENADSVTTVLGFERGPPAEVRVKLRVPEGRELKAVTVDGKAAEWQGEEVTLRLGASTNNVTVVGNF
ncbi:hypothetical protein CSHISOI_07548 [Colletotrichum shisoi]|uniref:Uncharacterized protein n=1 Tax=Colletotrichum shisoi TaxID=2078593 RepID=A0A5Q4BLS7_9PEZI|nr:hypothetical protein CSHISOI_07548 [Colletotrichum shisoi]